MPRVLVPLAQGCNELVAVTLIDLLRRAGISVVTAGLDAAPVVARRGTRLLADTTLDAALAHDYDMVVLPGGQPGSDNLNNDARIHTLLKKMAHSGKFIAAICAAPAVLAHAGLLDGKRATGFPGTLEKLAPPNITIENDSVVSDGKVITSRGPGTAMDFALELIELLSGKEKRDEVEGALQRPHRQQ